MKKPLLLALALAGAAHAQTATAQTVTIAPAAPAPSARMWVGGASELLVLPEALLMLSAPVAPGVELRGGAEVPLGFGSAGLLFTVLNAELLFSAPASNFYAGPSVGTIWGEFWAVGGVAGLRSRGPGAGYFGEVKARMVWQGGQVQLFSPGLRLGVNFGF